jgi:prepilin-type N-terminal cleavage/methylation domain-containing protein
MKRFVEKSSGFTLVELLVVIAIIGILAAMSFPAILAARERARVFSCNSNLMQLGLAIRTYENIYRHFPAGCVDSAGPVKNSPDGFHHNWISGILPSLNHPNLYRAIDFGASVYHPKNSTARQVPMGLLSCSSDPTSKDGYGLPASNYAASHHSFEAAIDADNDGMMFLNSQLRVSEVRDGLSCTLLLGEKVGAPNDLGWLSGTRATLRNVGGGLRTPRPMSVVFVDAYDTFGNEIPFPIEGSNTDPPMYDELIWTDKPIEKAAEKPSASAVAQETVLSPTLSLPEALFVGGFTSWHGGFLGMALADGSVRTWPFETSREVLQQLANRNDSLPLVVPE